MSGLEYTPNFNKNIQEILYKKYSGIVNTGQLIDNEYNVNASPSVFSSKIYLDPVPLTAPDKKTARNITNGTVQDGSGDYAYLKFYTVKLISLTGSGTNFVYDAANNSSKTGAKDSSDNILTDAIASNYDPNASYGITVKYDKVQGSGLLDGTVYISNYTFDRDAGVLSIYNKPEISAANPPTISFWRYEGRKGSSGFASDWSKYKALQEVDMSGFAIKGLPDISSTASNMSTLLNGMGDNYAVSVGLLKKYIELSGGSGGYANVDLTGKIMNLSGGAWDASGLRIDNIAKISSSNFVDYSNSAVTVNTMWEYLPKAQNRGEYLMWNLSGDSKWSVNGTNNVVLGKGVASTVGSGAVVIGTGAGASGVGNNSILIGANADASGSAVPKNTIILNATGSKLNDVIPARQDDKVVMYVKDLYSATTLNGSAKALYYDPSTNSIAAGDICGIMMYREDAGDASGWYRYPAEQAINMQGTPAGTDRNYIFGLQDPSSAAFTYKDATKGGAEVTLSGDAVYKTMATTVGWVQNYVSKNSSAGDVSDNQSAYTAVNDWVQKLVINDPPAPTFNSSTATSQIMSLKFNNPARIYIGAFDMSLPALKKIWVTTNVTGNTTILSGSTTYIPDVNEITELVFGSTTSSIVHQSYNSSSNTYYHKFTSDPAGTVQVKVWYTNGRSGYSGSTKNILTANIGPFASTNPPTAPSNLSITNVNDTNATSITWSAPQYYDSTDTTVTLKSTQSLNYRITLNPQNTSRAGGMTANTLTYENIITLDPIDVTVYRYTSASVNAGATVTYSSMATNTLFPSTYYYCSVAASNGGAYGTSTTVSTFTTDPPSAPPASFSLTIPSAATVSYYARSAKTTARSDPLVNSTDGANLSLINDIAIHTSGQIGQLSTDLTRTLTADIQNAGTSVDNEKSYQVKGFGDATVSGISAAASSAELSITNIRDYHSSDTLTNRKGYFKSMDVTPKIKANTLPNTLTTSNNAQSDPVLTYSLDIYGTPVTANFRVDDLGSSVVPSFSSTACSTATSSFTKISGLPHLENNAPLAISATINNLANRYYRQNGVTINLQNSANTTIGTNSHIFSDANEITFIDTTNNASINYNMNFAYTSGLYDTVLKAKIVATTVYDNTGNGSVTKNYLLDQLNFVRISQLLSEQTITAKDVYVLGYPRHVTNTVSEILDYTSTGCTNNQYDHSVSLNDSMAFQLVKGKFTTNAGNNTNAFNNYNLNDGSATDTTYDYSSITGMRCMAFSCAVNTGSVTTQSALKIRLNTVSSASTSVTDAVLTVGGNRVYIYYRYSGGNVPSNSVWIEATKKNNGANNMTTVTTSGNNPSSLTSSVIGGSSTGVNDDSTIVSGGNIQYENLIIPSGYVPNKITVLIATDNSTNISFDSVSIALG